MDDARHVRAAQPVGNLDSVLQRQIQREPALLDQLVERLAGDVLHHDDVAVSIARDVVNRDDVRMVEGGGGARLLLESLPAFVAGEIIGPDDLQGDGPVETGVVGLVDDAHAALADLFENTEASEDLALHRGLNARTDDRPRTKARLLPVVSPRAAFCRDPCETRVVAAQGRDFVFRGEPILDIIPMRASAFQEQVVRAARDIVAIRSLSTFTGFGGRGWFRTVDGRHAVLHRKGPISNPTTAGPRRGGPPDLRNRHFGDPAKRQAAEEGPSPGPVCQERRRAGRGRTGWSRGKGDDCRPNARAEPQRTHVLFQMRAGSSARSTAASPPGEQPGAVHSAKSSSPISPMTSKSTGHRLRESQRVKAVAEIFAVVSSGWQGHPDSRSCSTSCCLARMGSVSPVLYLPVSIMTPSAMAKALGRQGGRARARRLSSAARTRIASAGGSARAASLQAARRILHDLRYADAVATLRPAPPIARLATCADRLPDASRPRK